MTSRARRTIAFCMGAVLSSLSKAFGQLGDPVILRIVAKSLGVTLAIFVAFGGLLWWTLDAVLQDWLRLILPGEFEGAAAAFLLVCMWLLTFWLLFRALSLAVLQFFADKIVAAVEARHYPDLADKAQPLPLPQDIANSLKGLARALGFNLLALPIAIILLFTAIGPAVVFLIVNAVLLGRELTDMAWLRHTNGQRLPNPVTSGQRIMLGSVIAGMMIVPFVNLIAPIIGAAAGTHLAHDAMRRQEFADA